MLVAAGKLLDGMHVEAAFVRESRLPDEGCPNILRHVSKLIDKARKLAQAGQIRHAGNFQFDLQGRDDRRKVAITNPLPVSVDGALDLAGACGDSRKRVGNREPAVVVGMNPDRSSERRNNLAGDAADFVRQRAAIRIAEDDQVRAGILGGPHGA